MTDLLRQAVQLHQAGRHAEAETRYRAILAREPANADALHYLGLLVYGAGQYEPAADLLQQSVRANDRNPVAWSNLGNALMMLTRLPDAEAAFTRALRIDPGLADAAFNLGNALRQQKKYVSAEDSYRRAIAANPRHVRALNNLALVLDEQGKGEEAAQALYQLGNALHDLGRSEDAATAYWQSLDRDPNPGVEVVAALRTPVIPASVAEIDESRQRVATALTTLAGRGIGLADPLRYASSAIFYTAYHGRNDRDLRIALAKFYLGASPQLGWVAPHCANYSGPSGRIRVGVASKYLRPHHPIGKHFGAIVDRLDPDRFDVHRIRFRASMTVPLPGETILSRQRSRGDARAGRRDAARRDALPGHRDGALHVFPRVQPPGAGPVCHLGTPGDHGHSQRRLFRFLCCARASRRAAALFGDAGSARRPAKRNQAAGCGRGAAAGGFRAGRECARIRMRTEPDQVPSRLRCRGRGRF